MMALRPLTQTAPVIAGRPTQVVSVPTGGAKRYGIELQWGGDWTGTIEVRAPRGGVIHTQAVAAPGFAAFNGYADWPAVAVWALAAGGSGQGTVTADVYLHDCDC